MVILGLGYPDLKEIQYTLLILKCGKLRMRSDVWNQSGLGGKTQGSLILVVMAKATSRANQDCRREEIERYCDQSAALGSLTGVFGFPVSMYAIVFLRTSSSISAPTN